MIVDDQFLTELRSVGINSQNLKNLILQVAIKSQQLERELKGITDENNAKKPAQSESKAISTS